MERKKKLFEIVSKAHKDFSEILKTYDGDSGSDFDYANKAYYIAEELNILSSQLMKEAGVSTVYEGDVEVENAHSLVRVAGIEIRGKTRFSILKDGIWYNGIRENSQYGEVFVGEISEILHEGIHARIIAPFTNQKES